MAAVQHDQLSERDFDAGYVERVERQLEISKFCHLMCHWSHISSKLVSICFFRKCVFVSPAHDNPCIL